MNKRSEIAGVILAGGKSTRIGGINKSFLELDGTNIFNITIDIFDRLFTEIIIVTNSPEDYNYVRNKYSIATDIIKNIGPLGGIHSALTNCDAEAVFIVACDMPNLSKYFIHDQMEQYDKSDCDVLIPRIGSFIEPLHAIYKRSLYHRLHSYLKETRNYSIRNFIKTINVKYWDLDDNVSNRKAFTNINTEEDLVNTEDHCKHKKI